MWFLDLYGEDDDLQFIRNIRKACSRDLTGSSRNAAKFVLRSFVHELSFWEVPPSSSTSCVSGNEVRQRGKRRQVASKGATTNHSMTKGRSSNERQDMQYAQQHQQNYHLQQQFRWSTRSSSNLSADSEGQSSKVEQGLSAPSTQPVWKTAVDPASGRTYYYDAITRRTQWNKPPEVREMERMKRREKRRRDLEFFREMEANIRASLERGELIPGIPIGETKKEGPPLEPLLRPTRIRTISGMDDVLLAELRDDASASRVQHQTRVNVVKPKPAAHHQANNTANERKGRPPLPICPNTVKRLPLKSNSMELSPDAEISSSPAKEPELVGERLLDEPFGSSCDLSELGNKSPPNGHTRRNTGGTIYLQSTMENPDIGATIKCICGVYRTHIVQTAERMSSRSPVSVNAGASLDIDVFNDDYCLVKKRRKVDIPSLSDVWGFYHEFYRRSQMESDTIIMSLIYVERLVKSSNGLLSPGPANWRSVLFACMVLASKVWDDLSMWNVDFSNVSANTAGLSSFTLARINQLELGLLKCLNFDVKVPASEYAKYYFLIRTMLIRSGLVREVEKPLAKADAFRKLEKRTDIYQNNMLTRENRRIRRAKSLDAGIWDWLLGEKDKPGPVLQASVCLEQLVG